MKERKGLWVSFIVVLVIALLLGGFIVYDKFIKNREEEKEVAYKYELKVYKNPDNDDYLCKSYDNSSCKEIAFVIKTESEQAEIVETYSYSSSEHDFVLYADNGLKLYDVTSKTSKKLNLDSSYEYYNIKLNADLSEVVGILCNKDNDYSYYDILEEKEKFKGKYKNLKFIDENYLNGEIDNKVYLINSKTGEHEFEAEIANEPDIYNKSISSKVFDGKKFYIVSISGPEGVENVQGIYNENKKEVSSGGIGGIYNKYIYLGSNSDNTIKKYDLDGKLLSTNTVDGKILNVILDKVVLLKDNNLYLQNIENNEKIIVAKNLTDIYMDSGYYGSKEWFDFTVSSGICSWEHYRKSKEEGIVLFFSNEHAVNENDTRAYMYTITDSNKIFTENFNSPSQCF